MKKEWQIKRLGDVVEVLMGQAPSSKDCNFSGDGTPFVKVGEFGEIRPVIREWTTNPLRMAKFTDVLLCVVGATCGKINLGIECAIGRSVAAIRPEISKLDQSYLYCFMMTLVERLRAESVGAAQTVISKEMIHSVEIPLPPLHEQQQIVSILDEAFEKIATSKANAGKNLQNARALFDSHLNDVFTKKGKGWVEKKISNLCDIKHGYPFEGEFFSNHGDYVLLTPGNFYERGGYRDRGEKQKYYTGEIPRDYVLNEGDLLIAMTEQAAGLLGSPILIPESDKFLHNQRLGLVMRKHGVAWSNKFFFHVFNTEPVRRAIHASASGVKVRHTSPTKVSEVVVAFPASLPEQDRIVTTLASLSEETQRLETIYRQKLAELEALKKSLLDQAFSGGL
jgi:type I restriction enzyme S subunit